MKDGSDIEIQYANLLPDPNYVAEIREPYVNLEVIVPQAPRAPPPRGSGGSGEDFFPWGGQWGVASASRGGGAGILRGLGRPDLEERGLSGRVGGAMVPKCQGAMDVYAQTWPWCLITMDVSLAPFSAGVCLVFFWCLILSGFRQSWCKCAPVHVHLEGCPQVASTRVEQQ